MTELAAPPKRRIGLVIWLIVSQLLAVGSLVIWAIMAGLSVMAIGAWVAFAFRKNRLAAVLSGLTFVPSVLLLLLISL